MLSVSAVLSMQPLDHGSAGKADDIVACQNSDSINVPETFDGGQFSSISRNCS